MNYRTLFAMLMVAGTVGTLGNWPLFAFEQAAPAAESPVIVTTGEGSVKLAPDRVWVTLAAESRARSARDAQRANTDAMSAVLAKLKSLGFPPDSIRTSGYDVQPEFDYVNGKQTMRGYVARNAIEVRVDDITIAGDVLEVAVSAGATSVGGLRFDLKDRAGAEREALRKAVADARVRADAAAGGAGLRVDRVIRIEEQRSSPIEPRPIMMARQTMVGNQELAAPPVAPGEIEVRSTVTMTSTIK
jgi:uncharacterized protein YggE